LSHPVLRHAPGVYALHSLFVATRTSDPTLILVALVSALGLLLRFSSRSLSLPVLWSRLPRLSRRVLLSRLPLLALLALLPLLALLALVSIVEAFNRWWRRVSSLLPNHLLFGLCQLLALGTALLLLTLALLLTLLLTSRLLLALLLVGLLFRVGVLALFLLSMMLKLLIDDRLVCRWLPGILALGATTATSSIVGLLIRRGITVRFRTGSLVTGVVVIQMSYS
jgi:hypothetical protein